MSTEDGWKGTLKFKREVTYSVKYNFNSSSNLFMQFIAFKNDGSKWKLFWPMYSVFDQCTAYSDFHSRVSVYILVTNFLIYVWCCNYVVNQSSLVFNKHHSFHKCTKLDRTVIVLKFVNRLWPDACGETSIIFHIGSFCNLKMQFEFISIGIY